MLSVEYAVAETPLTSSCLLFLSYSRKLAMKILDVQDPDYYEWTTHIFFDDCMEPDDSGYEYQVWYLQYLVMPRLWLNS